MPTTRARKGAETAPVEIKMPPALAFIPEQGAVFEDGEKRLVKWGWREWRALAPRLQKHAKQAGRYGLAAEIREAQKDLIAPELQRTVSSVATLCSTKAKPDVLEIIAFAARGLPSSPPAEPRLALVIPPPVTEAAPEKARRAKRKPVKPPKGYLSIADACKRGRIGESSLWRFLKRGDMASMIEGGKRFVEIASLEAFVAARQHAIPAAAPASPQAPAQALPLPIPSAALAVPLAPDMAALHAFATLLPGLQTFIAAQVERHAQIVGRAIAQALKERAPRAAAPEAPQASGPAAGIAEPAGAPVGPAAPAHEARERAEKKEEPHLPFAEQVEIVAKAIGIEPPASVIDKKCILVVGLHPTVEQRVERDYGKFFAFRFKRPDAFNTSNDIPASADAVLIARKPHLPSEITGTIRRLNLFSKKISNDAGSVYWALHDFHPEACEGLKAPA